MYKTYLLTYDPLMTDPSPAKFLEFVRNHGLTYQFYVHHVGSVYIKSSAGLMEMIAGYRDFLSPQVWTICEIPSPAAQTGGSAPMLFWDWLNSASPPALPGQKS